jgi:NADH dehydrogenase FAD-containing subunit
MTVDTTLNQRLRVTIVGAGLCGLATGAAMREYADVTVSQQPGSIRLSLLFLESIRRTDDASLGYH